jgi:hypothetical protein
MLTIRYQADDDYKVVIEDEHEIIVTIAGGLDKAEAAMLLHFLNGGSLVNLVTIEMLLEN